MERRGSVEQLDEATARWLVSHEGLGHIATTTTSLDQGIESLRVGEQLRARGVTPQRAAAVVGAAQARRRTRADGRDAEQLVFTRQSLEQASHPLVARWRARRFEGAMAWDLCAGVGGDTIELARATAALTAVERDPALAVLLEHNLAVQGLDVSVLTADALEVKLPPGVLAHADPARRDGDRRLRALKDHRPAVQELFAAQPAVAGWALVLSPGVDLQDPDLPDGELEFLQVGDRLVEAVAWTGRLRHPAVATATLLPSGITRRRAEGPRHPLAAGPVGDHLVEVAPAAVRARLHDDIGREIGARRVDEGRALLTVDGGPPLSPWYRARPILAVLPARAKQVRGWLRAAEAAPVEFAFHGQPADVDRWWRGCGSPPRGPQGYRVEIVRVRDGVTVLVTDARHSEA